MKTVNEIQESIRGLSHGQRRDLIMWMHLFDDDYGVEEPSVAYAEQQDSVFMSEEEYLAFQARSDIRYEFVDGEVFAMSGGSMRHNLISTNLLVAFHPRLAGTPCKAMMSDVQVHVRSERTRCFYYPDLFVACGSLNLEKSQVNHAKLVIEVLSPSTQRTDQVEKAHNYRLLPTLEEYVLIAQHKPQLTVHRRGEGWQPQVISGFETVVRFESIDLELPLSQIYRDIF